MTAVSAQYRPVNVGVPLPLIGLSGFAQTGKDTIGEFLVAEHGYLRLAFADALRAVALGADPIVDAFAECDGDEGMPYVDELVHLSTLVLRVGWEAAKRYPPVREFLQKLGTDGCRTVFGDDIWLRPVEIQILENKWSQGIVVTDCRFENEAKLIRHLGGQVCRVERPGFGPITDHVSENALDSWPFDHVFDNDGTIGDLHRIVAEALRL